MRNFKDSFGSYLLPELLHGETCRCRLSLLIYVLISCTINTAYEMAKHTSVRAIRITI
jgi:hypothetical protein